MRIAAWTVVAVTFAASVSAAGLDPDLLAGLQGALDRPGGHERPGRRHRRGRVEPRRRLRRRGHRRRLEVAQRRPHLGAALRRPAGARDRRDRRSSRPNPAIVWVGTGEGNLRNSASVGNGIYRSLDGGKTWKHLGLDEDRAHPPHRRSIPTNPDVAWVCAPGPGVGREPRARRLQDRGRRQDLAARSSTSTRRPAAATWPSIPRTPTSCSPHVAVPALAVALQVGRPGLRPLRRPTTAATTWKRLQEEDGLPEGELGRIGLAVLALQPRDRLRAGRGRSRARSCAPTTAAGPGRRSTSKPNVAPRPFYFGDIRVDPAGPNRVFSLDYDVRVSDDGGKTFETLRGASGADPRRLPRAVDRSRDPRPHVRRQRRRRRR